MVEPAILIRASNIGTNLCCKLLLVLACIYSHSVAVAASSIWDDPERTSVAPFADGIQRTASTAQDILTHEPTRLPASENWVAARQKVSDSKQWTAWVRQQSDRLDQWTAQPRESAGQIGGWTLEFIDPNTGVRLPWTPATPRPQVTAPAPKGMNAQDQAWSAYDREYNIERTADAARLYMLTGRMQYAVWAAAQLDFYADNYQRWPLRTINGRGRMFAHGLDEATNVFALLDAARLLEKYAGVDRSRHWQRDLFEPMAENLKTITTPLSNIGLWQTCAIAAIAMRYKDEALLDFARSSPFGITQTLRADITRDNLWIEGSFSYNAYVLDALNHLLIAAAIEGQAAKFKNESESAGRLLLAPVDYRYADGSLPTTGDGTVGLQAQPTWLFLTLYRSVPTAFGLAQAAKVSSWDTLLDPPGTTAPPVPALPDVMTRLFRANYMAVLKSGAWQSFVRYGQIVANHAQAEALTYEVADGPTKITYGVGTVSYAAKQHGEYFTQAAAHNVPLIDGRGQGQIPSAAQPVRFEADQNRFEVIFPNYQRSASAARSWRVVGHGFEERTRITLADGSAPKRLGAVFNTACDVNASSLQASSRPAGPPRNSATAYWSNLHGYSAHASWQIDLQCGEKLYRLAVKSDKPQHVIIAAAPSAPLPTSRTSIYFEVNDVEFDYALTVERASQ